MPSANSRPLSLENLEERSMLAVGILDNGWLGVLGTKGNDRIQITGSGSYVTVYENGYASWSGSVPTVGIVALAGNDLIEVHPDVTIPVWVDGGKGNDDIRLGSGNDAVLGGKGNDLILGGAGSDYLFGEAGHDHIFGGEDVDVLSGGSGNDVIHGDEDGDFLSGEAGNDEIYGGVGDDLVDAGAGKDMIQGGDGIDELMGYAGADFIFGEAGDDLIDGGAGKDVCVGGDGDDRIKGGAGNDQLEGNIGYNILDRDKGKDQLSNGIEADLDGDSGINFSGYGGGSGKAVYQFVNDQGVLQVRLRVEVQNFPTNQSLNVYVDGVQVGEVVTDSAGNGTLVLSTAPTGSEHAFPADFPGVRPGAFIVVDGGVPVAFLGAYFVERPLNLPPMPVFA